MRPSRRDEWNNARRGRCGDVIVLLPPAPTGDTADLRQAIEQLTQTVEHMSELTDQLIQKVSEQGSVIASAIELINGFPAVVGEAVRVALEQEDLEDEQVNAAVVQATNEVQSQTQALRDALTANTGEQPPANPGEQQ